MAQSARVLGVIPARGGSKRVPRKNVREVGGKPLVGHAVEQAAAAALIDEAVVSTDDEEIREAAVAHGGNVPFVRPDELATDTAPGHAVVAHALDWYAARGERFDVVAMIQVTSPLRRPADIDGAISRLLDRDADSVVSVTRYGDPPFWAVETDGEGYLREYFDEGVLFTDPDEAVPRSQDLPQLCYPNGAVMAASVEAFRRHEGFYTDRTVGYEMPPERSVDVDEPFELTVARALFPTQSE